MATQIGTMMWVQNFFTGFLLVKLPFSLPERFKQLTQQVCASRLSEAYLVSPPAAEHRRARTRHVVRVFHVVVHDRLLRPAEAHTRAVEAE